MDTFPFNPPLGLHGFEAKLLLANPSLIGHLLRQVIPLKLTQVFDVPDVIVVIVALSPPDERVVQALCDSCAEENAVDIL